ncbi:hypothetical protein DH2020_039274 [Rehmannia glutinosa]|uniref:AUGMIN subunit 8 n=1 Tax=Rehmannia glutinosa TaxID=99300 RepID=A0ABR0UY47_REHGL
MDVCESEQALQKQITADTKRLPLVSAENKNGATRRVQTREVSSRYRSPTPSASTVPKRCPSPVSSRLSSNSIVSAPKRATSAERKRPSRPSSPPSPSTPIQDTTVETMLASRKISGNKLPESLWPSTMRSLSVSFQSDTYSIPVSKREKPVSQTPSDRTLRPSSNVAHRQAEISASRKPTPERKRSPLKGKNSADQLENSKPVDGLRPRLVDQHRWPSRMSMNRSIDLADKASKTSSLSRSGSGTPSLRRLSLDGASNKPLLKSTSDLLMQISRDESGKAMLNGCSVDESSLQRQKSCSSSSSDRTTQLVNSAARALSMPTPGSRPSSPSVSRGVSPSRAKAVNPSSRGPSPARGRPFSPSRQPQSSTSVLSFIADIKKGKKAANHIEDVHQLRLLYNRHLQWRYANARTGAVLQFQKVKAEGDVETVKAAVCSAVDVMQAMGSSLFSILSRVEGMNCLVSELADVAAQERAMLDECESVLGSTAAMQVEEYSLRTHLLQTKQAWTNGDPSIYGLLS